MKELPEDYNYNGLRAEKMADEQEWTNNWADYIKKEKRKRRWYNRLLRKVYKSGFCPECGSKLDYNHIGYKGDRGYCHSCGWRSDREENK